MAVRGGWANLKPSRAQVKGTVSVEPAAASAQGYAAKAVSPRRPAWQWTDLSPLRAQVKGTGPLSRPPRQRQDTRPMPRALHGAAALK
jgi:hypothetical protein